MDNLLRRIEIAVNLAQSPGKDQDGLVYLSQVDALALIDGLRLADRVAVAGIRLARGGSDYVREAVVKAYAEYARHVGYQTSQSDAGGDA